MNNPFFAFEGLPSLELNESEISIHTKDQDKAKNLNENSQWQQEMRTALKTQAEVLAYFAPWFPAFSRNYSLFLPRSLAAKIKISGPSSALWKQFLPDVAEDTLTGYSDPIGDHRHSPLPQLIHRYPKRVLFLPTTVCPVACRYCFRKNELNAQDELFKNNWKAVKEYLVQHQEIHEVIFSGGDPLILSDERIQFYLEEIAQIPHIRFIRFHTRTPVILPSRLTPRLLNIFLQFEKHFTQLNIVIHTNHVEELTLEVQEKLREWNRQGINFLSQSVFLKGVNDSVQILAELFFKLIELKIRPYYLHHPDQVKGGAHFYLPIEEGRKIYEKLRLELPGWAIPQYMIDIPGGEGKIWAYSHASSHVLNSPFGHQVPLQEPK